MADDSPFGLGFFYLFIGGSLALVVLTVVLLLGMMLVGGMAAGMGDTTGPSNVTASPDPITGEAVSFESTRGNAEINDIWSVMDSRGYGVGLNGANDSYVESDSNIALSEDDTWAVSTWARANATQTMTALSVNGRVIIQYNESVSEWKAWYYDDGSRNSYVATVAAPDQPGNLSLVSATRNQTHFWIYANTTKGDVVDVTADSVEDINSSATNWNGTLDETRVFDDVTNDSRQASLHSQPVAPQPTRERTARLMYDEGQGSKTDIYFADGRATLSNATWESGLEGNELTDGVDYTINQDAGEITALDGGRIDGAPVVWIEYNYTGLNRVGQLAVLFEPAFQLFSTGTILIPAVVVIGALLFGVVKAVRFSDGVDLRDRNNGR